MTTPAVDGLDLVATAFLAAARAAFVGSDFANRVHDGEPDDRDRPPYVVVWSDLGRLMPEKLSGRSTRHEVNWWVHCYGTSIEQARAASARLIGRVVDLRLPDAGSRRFGPLRLEASQPPRPETGLQPNLRVYDSVTSWRSTTRPA